MDSLKRGFDAGLTLIGLTALWPVLAAIAIWVGLANGRPVLFTQRRVGRFGRPFFIRKFRSMVPDAPSLGRSLTVAGDVRITRTGRFLRCFKLDELPQLWNVLRGEMSLVGPRPEVPEYVDLEDPRWREVLSVRPGMTAPSSLDYFGEEQLLARTRDAERFYRETLLPAKLELNVRYVRTRTFVGDVRVIGKTLLRCFALPSQARRVPGDRLFEEPT